MENYSYSSIKNIIFVLGTGRSGSTLLRSLLDGHPELVVWPFEFSYYSLFEDKWGVIGSNEVLEFDALLDYFLFKLNMFSSNFSGDLGQHTYLIENFNNESFFSNLNASKGIRCTRSEFLKILLFSYYHASHVIENSKPPKAFIIVHNQPASAILDDFFDAKLIAMIRDPIETYYSNKAFYFKACENTGRDKSSVFRPYKANKRFRSLLETSISPIIHTYNWFHINLKGQDSYNIYLEDLRNDACKVMTGLCNFIGIEFIDSCLNATFLGQVHHSNMSSGKKTYGNVVPQDSELKKNLRPKSFEYYWIYKNLYLVYDNSPKLLQRYSMGELSSKFNIIDFLKPMENEFPTKGSDKLEARKLKLFIVLRVARYLGFIISYCVNRHVFLTLNYQKILKSWPMAK